MAASSPELNPQPLPPRSDAWDEISTCPPWWPQLLWQLHFPVVKHPGGGPGPINYPPVIEDIMANLHVHTMSYLMLDQNAAQQLRHSAEQQLVKSVGSLTKLHDQAVKRAAVAT